MSKARRPRGYPPRPNPDDHEGPQRLKYLKMTGPISVKRVDEDDVPYRSYCMVFVGPTGSGKSSFIEALNRNGSNPSLDIAKDQLDSVTQQVTAYHLEGVTSYGVPIYLIDTPGFADPKISEMEILTGMKIWRAKSDGTTPRFEAAYVRVIYMCPITDTRLAGRRRNYLNMIQTFWGDRNKYRARLVTTMWDRLIDGTESHSKALERFRGLDDHWKDLWEGGSGSSYVLKFRNTHDSAMDILNKVCRTVLARSESEPADPVEGLGVIDDATDKTTLAVYKSLEERIESLQQRMRSIEAELNDSATMQCPELVGLLLKEKEECATNLEKFVREMAEYLEIEQEEVVERMIAASRPPPYVDTLLGADSEDAAGQLTTPVMAQDAMSHDSKVDFVREELQLSIQPQPQEGCWSTPDPVTTNEILNVEQQFQTILPSSHEPMSMQTITARPPSDKPPRILSLHRRFMKWFRTKLRFKKHSPREP